ncbi:MarR family winged helix-turn-helix transcriptional regulator [Noviherbaspirillum galbum]|uniref:MarR family transcriptional regulator n=1 Tax=Noviherbaspirillum galbum TaxID=2709383 RepID=A0A6B3SVX0_9BURK|nr:MarR family transcriptional regulator [Noviherbaspirillum galbum]NEX64688.1 MarR family transcriptional regulator [Noviherbaspirillum galbum]
MAKKREPVQKKSVSSAPATPSPAPTPTPSASPPFNPLRQVMWGRPGFLIRRLTQIGQAIFFDLCKSESITPLQVGMLTALSMNPWLDQKAIGRELALDRTTTAEVLKRLGDKGLVETRVNPDDRRSRLSVITKQGLRLINDLQESIARSQELLLEPLTPEERAVFMKLLTQLVDAHEKMNTRE